MKLDSKFVKEVLEVAFPGHDSILVIAEDSDETYHGYCLAGKGDHEDLLTSALETVVSHLHHNAGHSMQDMYRSNPANYYAIMSSYAMVTSLNLLKKSVDAEPDGTDVVVVEAILEKLVDITQALLERANVSQARNHD